MVLSLRQPEQAVFDNDDGAVDDQAEVERAEAHQVARNLHAVHADRHHQERQRNDQHSDEGGADVAKQQEEGRGDQDRALGEVALDGADGGVDEHRSIQGGVDDDARRQRLLHIPQLDAHGLGHRSAVLADQHQRRANDGFLSILGRGARAQVSADADHGDVLHHHRNRLARGDDGVGDLVERSHAGIRADQVGLAGALDEVRANRKVGGLKGLCEVCVGDPIGGQLRRVRLDDVLLGVATDRVDAGHAAHRAKLRPDDPVLDGAKVARLSDRVGEAFALGSEVSAIALPAR